MQRFVRFSKQLAGAAAMALLVACQANTGSYRSALTGEECTPNDSFVPRGNDNGHGNNGHANENGNGNHSPTGIPGDNLDDLRSGQVDCLGDGNSGQGDDKKHDCEIPPGCDDEGCCDENPPTDPPTIDPPTDDPPPEICLRPCMISAQCADQELTCSDGCCVPDIL